MPQDPESPQSHEIPQDNELWQYSLRTYRLPGLADLALHWQELDGINVNILLWSTWLEREGVQLSETLLDEVMMGASQWDLGLVQTLRQLRNKMKRESFGPIGEPEALGLVRKQVLAAELQAEQCQQAWLYNKTTAFLAEPRSMHHCDPEEGENIVLYLRAVLTNSDEEELRSRAQQWLGLSVGTKPC